MVQLRRWGLWWERKIQFGCLKAFLDQDCGPQSIFQIGPCVGSVNKDPRNVPKSLWLVRYAKLGKKSRQVKRKAAGKALSKAQASALAISSGRSLSFGI